MSERYPLPNRQTPQRSNPQFDVHLVQVSRYEHSLIADLLLHVRGAHGDLLKNFTPQLSVKEYD
jgi:hypothetical protein